MKGKPHETPFMEVTWWTLIALCMILAAAILMSIFDNLS